jgi:hypothetical protein
MNRENLLHQLKMNKVAWSKLTERGYQLGTPISLDFAFIAFDEGKAKDLKGFLDEETDYETRVIFNESWEVTGKTRETEISLDVLNQWVEWMVTAGQNFECEFDGWGAEVP